MNRPALPFGPRAALALLGGILLAVYAIAWPGPFVLDDVSAIVGNASLRTWTPPWAPLVPPHEGGLTVGGRPLLNLSFALNWALAGPTPWAFRATNLAIHFGSALLVFALVRRARSAVRPAETDRATWVPLAVAAGWALHPLQTAAVSYVVQRAESLAAWWVLLTLYAFVRSTESPAAGRWRALAWVACLAGMATKETAAATPLLVLLWDRTFVAGTFTAAWRERGRFHLALAGTWLLLGALAWQAAGRGASAGFASAVGAWPYLLTQADALVHYLRLVVWPAPLVFDHGTPLVTELAAVWPQGLLVLGLLAGTLLALRTRPVVGFLGAWFFLLLAPSSSFVPVATQTVAEHRMYLPSVAPLVLVVAALARWRSRYAWVPVLTLLAAAAMFTAVRNFEYRSALGLWAGVVQHAPDNARGRLNFATALLETGRLDAALREFGEAARLDPRSWKIRNNWGEALRRAGRREEALAQLELAAAFAPAQADPLVNRGNILLQAGRIADALAAYDEAIRREPTEANAHFNRGCALAADGRFAEAVPAFERTLALRPDYAEARRALERLAAPRPEGTRAP